MAVSTGNTLKNIHNRVHDGAQVAVTSDFTAQIVGYEDATFKLVRQIPWAVLTTGEAMEVPGPMGTVHWQATQANGHQQGAVAFLETVTGSADALLVALLAEGGTFDMVVYEGTPERFTRAKRYKKCSLTAEPVDRDWESRQQPLQINGTLFYHYYGDDLEGNAESVNG